MRMLRLTTLLLPIFVCACASPYTPLAHDSPALDKQTALIGSLKQDESLASISSRFPYRIEETFDFQDAARRITYLSLKNDDTGASFGLLFVDDRLTYVLPPIQAGFFSLCRDISTPAGSHWTINNLAPILGWMNDHSILGTSIRADYQVPVQRRRPSNTNPALDTALDAATVAVYSPFIIFAAPGMVHGAFRDKDEKEARERQRQQQAEELLRRLEQQQTGFTRIHLGNTRNQVIQVMGNPDKSNTMADGAEYLWYEYKYGVLLRNGKVTLKENLVFLPFWARDKESIAAKILWMKSRHFDPAIECFEPALPHQANDK